MIFPYHRQKKISMKSTTKSTTAMQFTAFYDK